MTVVVRGSVVSGQAAGVSGPTFTVSVPTATQTGDYLLLLITTNKDTVTPASGWTLLQNGSSASLPSQSLLYGKVAVAGDAGGTTYSWSVSGTTNAPNVAVCWAFGNVDSTKIVSAKSSELTSSSVTTPAVTTTVSSLMVHLVADRRGSTPSITWTYASGTKTEGTNDGSVGYTASGAPASSMATTTGSQAGISLTGSAAPSTAFAYQVGLGDGLTVVNGADTGTGADTATVKATIPAADTGAGTDTAVVSNAVSVGDAATGVDTSKVTVYAADVGSSTEGVTITSGGATLAFGSDSGALTDAATPLLLASDRFTSLDLGTAGVDGPLIGVERVYLVDAEDRTTPVEAENRTLVPDVDPEVAK